MKNKISKFNQKIFIAIIPILTIAISGFFIENWISGIATKNDLLTDYEKKEVSEIKYLKISEHKIYLSKINSLESKIDELHKDVRILIYTIAQQEIKPGEKKKNKTALAQSEG